MLTETAPVLRVAGQGPFRLAVAEGTNTAGASATATSDAVSPPVLKIPPRYSESC